MGLSEDELFVMSIVTVRPGICGRHLREIYVEECELVGRTPLSHKRFDLCVMRLVAKKLLRVNRRLNAAGAFYRSTTNGGAAPREPQGI